MYNILVCDDEKDIVSALSIYLKSDGYQVYKAYNGKEALELVQKGDIHLVLMDIMMPEMDGIETMVKIREISNVPVILLTAKSEDTDKVLGLTVGADDYIMKPFDSKEMVARVKAVLRRSTKATVGESTPTPTPQVPQQELEIVTFPDLQINLSDYSVHYKDQMIEMPPKELELFYFLASHPNQVFTREQLLDHIWSYDYIGDTRTVDVHIKRLREKFKDHDQWKLATVWGIGYKFEFHEKGNA